MDFGLPITGYEYIRLPEGPAPKNLASVTRKMKAHGDFAIQDRMYYGYIQKRPIALRQADISLFDAKEIDLVDRIVQTFWEKTASEISDKSHGFIGWAAADNMGSIPYNIALLGTRPPTAEEEKKGLELDILAKKCLAGHAQA